MVSKPRATIDDDMKSAKILCENLRRLYISSSCQTINNLINRLKALVLD